MRRLLLVIFIFMMMSVPVFAETPVSSETETSVSSETETPVSSETETSVSSETILLLTDIRNDFHIIIYFIIPIIAAFYLLRNVYLKAVKPYFN